MIEEGKLGRNWISTELEPTLFGFMMTYPRSSQTMSYEVYKGEIEKNCRSLIMLTQKSFVYARRQARLLDEAIERGKVFPQDLLAADLGGILRGNGSAVEGKYKDITRLRVNEHTKEVRIDFEPADGSKSRAYEFPISDKNQRDRLRLKLGGLLQKRGVTPSVNSASAFSLAAGPGCMLVATALIGGFITLAQAVGGATGSVRSFRWRSKASSGSRIGGNRWRAFKVARILGMPTRNPGFDCFLCIPNSVEHAGKTSGIRLPSRVVLGSRQRLSLSVA